MKIMTFNIQSGRRFPEHEIIDLDFCAKVIEKYNPDFLGINEINIGETFGNQPAELAKKLGYSYFGFCPALCLFGNSYANAFLSKHPIKNVETIIIPDPQIKDEDAYYETRCVAKTTIDVNGKDFTFLVTHMGLANSEKQNAVDTVCKILGANPKNSILMGDFNMTPDDKRLDCIRKIMRDTADYEKDAFLSWPADKPEVKLDYIFASPDILTKNPRVIPEIGSDHRAYMCEIEL